MMHSLFRSRSALWRLQGVRIMGTMLGKITERSDFLAIANATLEEFSHLASPRAADHSLRMTSGTTSGTPLLILWDNNYAAHRLFAGASRSVICSGLLSVRLGNALLIRNGMAEPQARVLCLDASDVSPSLTALLADFAPDSFYGFPSFVARVAAHMDTATGKGVRTLSFTGENISPVVRSVLDETFPQASTKLVYNTNETGALSQAPCGNLPLDSYHPLDGVVFTIHEPDETGAGDVLVSKKLTPGIEASLYRIGDIGRLRTEPCRCGAQQTLQVLGRRGYDYIKIAGALLLQKEFERVAALCESLFSDYRVEVAETAAGKAQKGLIRLRVFRKEPAPPGFEETVRASYEQALFLSPSKTLGDFIRNGAFLPLEVLVSHEPFPAAYKNLKLTHKN